MRLRHFSHILVLAALVISLDSCAKKKVKGTAEDDYFDLKHGESHDVASKISISANGWDAKDTAGFADIFWRDPNSKKFYAKLTKVKPDIALRPDTIYRVTNYSNPQVVLHFTTIAQPE